MTNFDNLWDKFCEVYPPMDWKGHKNEYFKEEFKEILFDIMDGMKLSWKAYGLGMLEDPKGRNPLDMIDGYNLAVKEVGDKIDQFFENHECNMVE